MSHTPSAEGRFAAAADPLAHIAVQDCYQCGKCTAGCPVAERMDVLPNQIVRLVQLGAGGRRRARRRHLAMRLVPDLHDTLPEVGRLRRRDGRPAAALERSRIWPRPAPRRTVVFQQAFLDNIRRNGRLNELELIGAVQDDGISRRPQRAVAH